MSDTFDLLVLGGGPGGVAAAVRGVQLGAKVGLVESIHWGGFCLNRACVPTKLFTTTVDRSKTIQTAGTMGFSKAEGVVDPAQVFKLKNDLVGYFSMGTKGLAKVKGTTPIEGRGCLAGPGKVSVGDTTYEAKSIVMATGAEWVKPSFPGADLAGVIHSSRFLEEEHIPARALILGDSPWSVELAQFLSICGSRVVLAAPGGDILPGFDQEIGQRLRGTIKNDGLDILNSCRVVSAAEDGVELTVVLSVKGVEETRRFDRVIYVDRAPVLAGLGLETVGLSDLSVDERMATKAPGIWAVGDAVGREPFLSHQSTTMGIIAAENALGANLKFNPNIVPRVAFTSPQAASVGMTEEQAEEAGWDVMTGAVSLGGSPMAMIQGATGGMVKVVGEKQYGQLLGVHIMSPFATEIIGAGVLAVQMEATLEELARSAMPHPTISESLSEAAREALGWTIYVP